MEIPVHLPREVKIVEIYDDDELTALKSLLASGMLTKRDTAVCRLLLETGLRGIDVCLLKLKDIDWEKDSVSIMQSKTKKPLVLPLRASYGNAIADYILHGRPESDSDYVFLRTAAPFGQLGTGSIYGILKKLEGWTGIKKEGRQPEAGRHGTTLLLPCYGQASLCLIFQQLSGTGIQTSFPHIFQRMPGAWLPVRSQSRQSGKEVTQMYSDSLPELINRFVF